MAIEIISIADNAQFSTDNIIINPDTAEYFELEVEYQDVNSVNLIYVSNNDTYNLAAKKDFDVGEEVEVLLEDGSIETRTISTKNTITGVDSVLNKTKGFCTRQISWYELSQVDGDILTLSVDTFTKTQEIPNFYNKYFLRIKNRMFAVYGITANFIISEVDDEGNYKGQMEFPQTIITLATLVTEDFVYLFHPGTLTNAITKIPVDYILDNFSTPDFSTNGTNFITLDLNTDSLDGSTGFTGFQSTRLSTFETQNRIYFYQDGYFYYSEKHIPGVLNNVSVNTIPYQSQGSGFPSLSLPRDEDEIYIVMGTNTNDGFRVIRIDINNDNISLGASVNLAGTYTSGFNQMILDNMPFMTSDMIIFPQFTDSNSYDEKFVRIRDEVDPNLKVFLSGTLPDTANIPTYYGARLSYQYSYGFGNNTLYAVYYYPTNITIYSRFDNLFKNKSVYAETYQIELNLPTTLPATRIYKKMEVEAFILSEVVNNQLTENTSKENINGDIRKKYFTGTITPGLTAVNHIVNVAKKGFKLIFSRLVAFDQ